MNVSSAEAVYVVNEGNFQFGNASISLVSPSEGSVIEDYFNQVNDMALGDVCQSITYHEGRLYIVVNNSGKVVVTDAETFEFKKEYSDLNSPRYFLPVSNSKAYVSDLYENAVYAIDLRDLDNVREISISSSTEQMEMLYGEVFVVGTTGDHIYVIDASDDRLIDSIPTAREPRSMVMDANDQLWVLCAGGEASVGVLMRIDPINRTIVKQFEIPGFEELAPRLVMNAHRDTIYYLDGGVKRMPIDSNALPQSDFIPENDRNFYGIGVDPRTNRIYVADAIDFTQRGEVLIYDQSGNEINSFKAGIIPSSFYFPN